MVHCHIYYINFCLLKVTSVDTSSGSGQGDIFFKAKCTTIYGRKLRKEHCKKYLYPNPQ